MPHPTVSIAFQTDQPLAAYGALAQAAEGYGFDGVTVYNDMLYQPAWLPLLEIARHTKRVRIGPAAVNPFTCHPINIAGNIALLDEASQGRAYLGLARGAWLDFVGIEPQRPVAALREALECVRHLLAQSKEPYRGEIFQLAGGDALRWNILRPDIPLLLGSWGAQTIRACIAADRRDQDRRDDQPGRDPAGARRRRSGRAGGRPRAWRGWPGGRRGHGGGSRRRGGASAGTPQGRAVPADHRAARPYARSRPGAAGADRGSGGGLRFRPGRPATSPMRCCAGWRSPARPARWPSRRLSCTMPASRASSSARRTG